MKKNPKAFLEYLLKYIPANCRTVEEGQYTYNNLRLMVENFLKDYDENYPEDYSEEQLKNYLKSKGYCYDRFMKWISGQTVGLTETGEVRYYKDDVERYKE